MSKELEKLKDINISKVAGEVVDSIGVSLSEMTEDFTSLNIGNLFQNENIFYKEYCSEDLSDLTQDLDDAIIILDLPEESGITKGTFIVSVQWIKE